MKKLLILMMVLFVTGAASASTITLLAPTSGPGTAGDPLENGEGLRVYVAVSDSSLDTLAATITAAGDGANITAGITGGAEIEDYGVKLTKAPDSWGGGITSDGGWQSALSLGSAVDSATVVRMQAGMFGATIHGPATDPITFSGDIPANTGMSNIDYITPIAYIDITGDGSGNSITLTITNGAGNLGSTSVESDGSTVPGFGDAITIYTVPEPITIALLGFGGLFLRRRK